jgi:arylamine N-acetyltransferase
VIPDIIGLMTGSPLDPPRDPLVLGMFLEHFGLHAKGPPPPSSNRRLLEEAAAAFSTLPYENLTKVLKRARSGSAEGARRAPLEVVSDHIAHGTGGTCFSLTAAFLHIARALGWRAEPILADRHYGADTHCALLVWVDGAPHLLDPGFLIHRPVPLDGLAETRISTGFNDVILAPRPGGEKVDLITVQDGVRSVRLTFKKEPVDPGRFLRVWDDSFSWEMMRYPLLTRARGASHLYLRQSRLQVRRPGSTWRSEVAPADLPGIIQREFGLDAGLTRQALEMFEMHP